MLRMVRTLGERAWSKKSVVVRPVISEEQALADSTTWLSERWFLYKDLGVLDGMALTGGSPSWTTGRADRILPRR